MLRLRIGHRGLIMASVPSIIGIICTSFALVLMSQAETDAWHEAESKAIVSRVNAIGRNFYTSTHSLVMYWLGKSNNAKADYDECYVATLRDLEALQELAVDNPTQMGNVLGLQKVCNSGFLTLERAHRMVDQEGQGSVFLQGAKLRHDVTYILKQLTDEAQQVVKAEQQEQEQGLLSGTEKRNYATSILYLSLFWYMVLALFSASFFSKGITKRLSILVENARRLARREPLHKPLAGGDEIAYLDHAFHEMANKLAEFARKERAIIDKAVDVICSIDRELKFSAVNPASLQVWGYAPDELIGTKFTDLIVDEDKPSAIKTVEDMIGGKTVKSLETKLVRKDGTVIDTEWSSTWSQEENSLFCVAHDVTERRELERLKQEFVAMVSHDLRTPLTSIQFAVSYVLQVSAEELSKESYEELQAADRIGENLINFINSLLDMEKLAAGKLEVHPHEMKVSSLLSRAVEAVQGFAHGANVKVVKEETTLEVNADEDRLLQVLVNLLANAVKFSPPSGTVYIAVEDGENYVQISVRDQGKGIPKAYKEVIFDRFQQVKMSRFRQKGTGLGLAIAKAMVEAHGGRIGVDSEEGEGSTFWFRIPKQSLLITGQGVQSNTPAEPEAESTKEPVESDQPDGAVPA